MYIIQDKRRTMEPPAKTRSEEVPDDTLAIVLEGVSEKWQMNVLQFRGCPTSVKVRVDGFGTVEAPAISLTPEQARHLATQITEILGPETANRIWAPGQSSLSKDSSREFEGLEFSEPR
jgi:hypothetical protein